MPGHIKMIDYLSINLRNTRANRSRFPTHESANKNQKNQKDYEPEGHLQRVSRYSAGNSSQQILGMEKGKSIQRHYSPAKETYENPLENKVDLISSRKTPRHRCRGVI